ncbi:MAG: TIGR02647 family protein [Oceanospirillaceae bacterium]|uniref:TIGR02647 family protein n=1 Tax=unclassified Thalassolituus TaxID=2624967 RepID=UPI000C09CDED|nr:MULTISPECIES: TIGR02647 family protein [unclassified Thalassolituus]MAK91356.1 TIGR02647 family protein [Thalassolituus sp.]MAS24508.1 TIGR02647 family protein [Oceanospirillaceae bacterium]MAY00420.1 TIGR02647 family protein [Oceanospirillaceae bacterium]MBL34030.1 TIGR02647 family protein [Oceanospirillaceae bacterium]MBS52034.1 TIGR02647 family protein [Oceanospirillaceae bacterium]|tara:strand:+ start:268 stop:516 length:249 start_codon:yes stop_codon:yes gene_type:complete
MPISSELMSEMTLLAQFDLHSMQKGIKVHNDASPELLAAVKRLHEKGLIDDADGGYLTSLGHTAAEHLQYLLEILKKRQSPE